MLYQNLTPFLFATKVTSRRPPQPEMTVVVRARYAIAPDGTLSLPDGPFPLCQGMLSAELFQDDDDERIGECIYPGDFADYKLNAEVMLKGSCHTPRGEPLTECPVRVSVGSWSKTLRVVGPRVWVDSLAGSVPSNPVAFTVMPLGYAHAFGGPGHAPNPSGKGLGTRELPSVERPGEQVRTKRDRPAPAGFGPLSPYWPTRIDKLGKAYGPEYRKNGSPFYAKDFDWTHFHAAPADQQLQGYLRGDESVSFHNLHPQNPVLSTRLPAQRVRAFVNDTSRNFREVPLSLDTLYADLDDCTLTLTWRGLTEVRELDLSDVTAMLFACEALVDPPLPKDHYRALLDEFERDPVNARGAVPEAYRDVWDRMVEQKKAGSKSLADELPAPGLEGLALLLEKRLGAHAAPAAARIRATAKAMSNIKAPPGVNLQDSIDKAVKQSLAARPAAVAMAPGVPPRVAIAKRLRGVFDKIDAVKKTAAAQGVALPAQFAELEKVANDARLKQLDPNVGAPETPEPLPGPGVVASGLDWSGRDLRGVDLSNADLTDTLLTGADLRGAKLAGAKLVRAVLFEADAHEADFSAADLTYANLGGIQAPKALFRGATLSNAHLVKANLAGAVLVGANAELPMFEEADLSGVDARRATFTRAQLERARIEGANFSEAQLLECRFVDASGRSAKFDHANLERTSFQSSNLAGASFTEVRGKRTVWIKAQLENARFDQADLPSAHFEEARAAHASFVAADLKESRFYRSVLDHADFTQANLFAVDMRHARLRRVKFVKANLYDGKLVGAAGEACDFNGANLKRAIVGTP